MIEDNKCGKTKKKKRKWWIAFGTDKCKECRKKKVKEKSGIQLEKRQ